MRHRPIGKMLLIGFTFLMMAACGSVDRELQAEATLTVLAEAPEVELTETPVPPSPTTSPTITPTSTSEPTTTATQAARVSVSENSNCRSGPGVEYLFKGVLAVGEVAEVIGRSVDTEFWYISNPDIPDENCWLWGVYAQVEGEVDAIPVVTPAPSPTPLAGFEVYVKSFLDCGYSKMIVFAVRNAGSQRIWSGYVDVQDLGTGGSLYKARERHPFAGSVRPACPPDHGNELWPGETRYIHVPVSPEKSGIEAVGIITLCTADHQGGTCITEYSYFVLP